MTNDQILLSVKEKINHRRFIHTKSVIQMAQKLAKIYPCDYDKVTKAAILHDILKDMSLDFFAEFIKKNKLNIDVSIPEILHGLVGAEYIFLKYRQFIDFEIIQAVKYHSTCNVNLSRVGLIIFIADYIEPLRCGSHFDDIRQMVGKFSLHDIAVAILLQMQDYLALNNCKLSNDSVLFLERYN